MSLLLHLKVKGCKILCFIFHYKTNNNFDISYSSVSQYGKDILLFCGLTYI